MRTEELFVLYIGGVLILLVESIIVETWSERTSTSLHSGELLHDEILVVLCHLYVALTEYRKGQGKEH